MSDTATGAAALGFDPFSDEYFNDPYDRYRRMRDEAPVWFSEKYGFWALFRYHDVCEAHKDWQTFSSAHGIDLSTLGTDAELIRTYRLIIMMDPPEHDRMRALVSRVFTPRAVGALEPMVREVITSYLEPFDGAEGFDAVADFAAPSRSRSSRGCWASPRGSASRSAHRLDLSLRREPGQKDPSPEGVTAMLDNVGYFLDLIKEKRRRPGDDMISRLTQVEVDRGDGEARLDDEEIAGFATLLGGAGAETVTKLVGNAVVPLPHQPRRVPKVLDDPDEDPRRRRGDPPLLPALAVPGEVLGARVDLHRGEGPGRLPHHPGHRLGHPGRALLRPARRSSTSTARRAWPWASATASTAAWARPWPAWRAGSPSRSCSAGGRASRSTRPGSAGCRCPTWPASPTSRCAESPDPPRPPGATGGAAAPVDHVTGFRRNVNAALAARSTVGQTCRAPPRGVSRRDRVGQRHVQGLKTPPPSSRGRPSGGSARDLETVRIMPDCRRRLSPWRHPGLRCRHESGRPRDRRRTRSDSGPDEPPTTAGGSSVPKQLP